MAIKILTTKNTKFKGNAEDDNVTGSSIADSISGGLGNDTLLGNAGKDTLDGGNGDDSLDGGADDDKILGGAGADSLSGGDGNDILDGGAGNDTLDGGTGADKMTGGAGDDYYYIDNVGDKVTEATSASGGKNDTVDISVALNWKNGNFSIFTGVENYILSGEEDLIVAGDNNANTITGNDGNNVLYGNGGNDTLNGGGGDDTLDGGKGIDVLNGGDGNDTYLINNVEDMISDDSGIDTIQSGETITIAGYSTVEDLTLTGTKQINGTGNDNDNIIEGNTRDNQLDGGAGKDTLNGGEGNDTLVGGSGEDLLDGGDGDSDLALYNDVSSNYTISLVDNVWEVTNINTDEVDELDNIELIQFSDTTAKPLAETDPTGNAGVPILSIDDIQVTEGNSNGTVKATVQLKLSQKSNTPVTVEIHTEDGTATASQDYQALTPYTVTIPAGDKTAKIDIPIVSDTAFEPDETFFVSLANPQGAELDSNTATITILNDDKPSISVASDIHSVNEGDKLQSSAKVVVSLPAPATSIVTVDYKTMDGTATSAGDTPDFKSTSGTLTFQVGQTSQTISVPFMDDSLVENNENFKVILSKATGASLGSNSTTTVTIVDNDGVVTKPTLSIDPTVSVGEGAGSAQLKVSLSSASTSDVTVNYDTTDGTAKGIYDFTGASKQTLTFRAGETSKTILIPITEDALVEGDETFNVVLSNAAGANLGTNSSSKVTIIDNDKANQVPVATDDSYQNLTAGTAFIKAVSDLMSNDKDADGGTLSVAAVSNAIGGSVALDASKTNVTFTPTDANVTSGSFQYTLSDGQGGTANATVNLGFKLAPVNKPPVAVNDSYSNLTAGVALSKPVTDLLANDSDPDGDKLALTAVSNAVGGSIALDANKTNFTFTPTNANTTTGSFQYTLSDGQGGTANATVNLGFAASSTPSNAVTAFPADARTYDFELPLTESADPFTGSALNEKIMGLGGNDTLNGAEGNDYLDGGYGNDSLNGGAGNDWIDGGAGNDWIDGGIDDNFIILGDGNDTVYGGATDFILGGDGNDIIYSFHGNGVDGYDTIDAGAGNDSIYDGNGYYGNDYMPDLVHGGTGDDYIEDDTWYDMTKTPTQKLYGDEGNDKIIGCGELYGGDGNDFLENGWGYFNCYLQGDTGNDTLKGRGEQGEIFFGGLDSDKIETLGGADIVRYQTLADSKVGVGNRDIIIDFDSSSGDVIDLYRISTGTMSYLGNKAFDGIKNEVRIDIQPANQITVVQVDIDGDTNPDMEIELTGIKVLVADDFMLKAP
jgi:Ca2+-binding RTX toxin-like protein